MSCEPRKDFCRAELLVVLGFRPTAEDLLAARCIAHAGNVQGPRDIDLIEMGQSLVFVTVDQLAPILAPKIRCLTRRLANEVDGNEMRACCDVPFECQPAVDFLCHREGVFFIGRFLVLRPAELRVVHALFVNRHFERIGLLEAANAG